MSDRQIARGLGVDNKTVSAQREELQGREEIPHVSTRTDTLGRKQPSTRAKAVKRLYEIKGIEGPGRPVGDNCATVAQLAEDLGKSERRMGELLMHSERADGGRPSKTSTTMLPVSPPTLTDLGVSKQEKTR